MNTPLLHPTALIETGAVIGAGVSIGAYAIIRSGAILGAGCRIASHVVIHGGTKLGEAVEVDCFSAIGGAPQDHSFDCATRSGVSVGARTKLREGVTIHRATKAGNDTTVGSDCLLMGNSHVAHDATIGDHVILANGALIAGHVSIGDRAFVSGNVCVHQFCRIGAGSMLGAGCVITEDVPPHGVAAERNRLAGLNVVGMRRQGVPTASISEIRACYRRVYLGVCLNLENNAASAITDGLGITPEGRRFLDFFVAGGGKRHRFCRPNRSERAEPGAAIPACA